MGPRRGHPRPTRRSPVRRLIHRVTEEVDQLTDAERAQIQQAAAIVRKTRQGFLGMPRIPPTPARPTRPERPA